MMNYLLIFISTTAILFNYHIYGTDIDTDMLKEPIVRTKYGDVQGFNALNGSIAVFFGIPYARPPLGKYRFEKPHEPEKWHGILNVTTQRNGCYPHTAPMDQSGNFIGNFTEDCLILNIFAPFNRMKKHPVFMLIHGGAFETGSAGMFSNYTDIGFKFVRHGIVVVIIQYRLGELGKNEFKIAHFFKGFASTGDQIMPGNLGLWDQTAALKWVQENIAAFGGDPKQITVKGQSAGAMSVGALTLSPHSRDLFSRAIQMSGSSMDFSTFGSRVPNETIRMATILGCSIHKGSKAIKNCLKQKSAEELMITANQMGQGRREPNAFFFSPRFDGEFFPNITRELVKEAPKKETIFGFNKLESLMFTLFSGRNSTVSHQMLPWDEIEGYRPEQFRNYISTFVTTKERFGANLAEEVADKIFKFYSTREENSTNGKNNYFYIRQWTEMLSDIGFVVPMIREMREKVKNGWPTYLYHFDYVDEKIFAPQVKIHESFHAIDKAHVFRLYYLPEFHMVESKIEAFMVDAFRNFIKTGNPSRLTQVPFINAEYHWPEVSPHQLNHFAIKLPKPIKMSDTPKISERVKFWDNLAVQYPQFDLILERSHRIIKRKDP